MGMNKPPVILLLLVVLIVSTGGKPSGAEGRALSLVSLSHQGYSKIFATLGVVCKCCDGIDGACTNTWTDSCSNLQCSPWKSH